MHILAVAKDVFLEEGFERASMDMIAARAETSKRTLYAHFENKERLFEAVMNLLRGLFLGKLKTPADYPGVPVQALTMFGARFMEVLLYTKNVQMSRMLMTEADRFPGGAAQFFDVVFNSAHELLRAYLRDTLGWSDEQSELGAWTMLAMIVYPRYPRALLGLEPLSDCLDAEVVRPDFDFEPVRKAVETVLGTR